MGSQLFPFTTESLLEGKQNSCGRVVTLESGSVPLKNNVSNEDLDEYKI